MEKDTKVPGLPFPWFRPRLAAVMVPSLAFFLCMFITVPLAVQVLVELVCVELDEEDCNSSRVSSQSSVISLIASLSVSIPSFLLSGFYGSLADRFGRKLCMVLPLSGYLVYAFILVYMQAYKPSYFAQIYVAGNFVMGITGSFAAFQMAIFAYAADITNKSKEKRGMVYSLLEACLFFAKIVGPLGAGLYAQAYGFLPPLYFSIAGLVFGIAWVIAMPDSLAADSEVRKRPIDFDPLRTLRNLYIITVQGGLSSPVPYLSLAYFLYFASYIGAQGSVNVLYLKHEFQWGPQLIGYYDAAEGLVQMTSMTIVPWLITQVFGVYIDKWWLFLGYVVRALHFLLFGIAPSTTFVFALVPLLVFSGPLTPRTRAIFSNATSPDNQASVLSAFSALQSLAMFVSPAFGAGYSVSVYYCPGCMYFVFASLTGVAGAIMAWVIARNLLASVEQRDREYSALARSAETQQVNWDGEAVRGGIQQSLITKGGENDKDEEAVDQEYVGYVVASPDGYDTISSLHPIQQRRQNSRTMSAEKDDG